MKLTYITDHDREARCLWCGERFKEMHSHEIPNEKWDALPSGMRSRLMADPGPTCGLPCDAGLCVLQPGHGEDHR